MIGREEKQNSFKGQERKACIKYLDDMTDKDDADLMQYFGSKNALTGKKVKLFFNP